MQRLGGPASKWRHTGRHETKTHSRQREARNTKVDVRVCECWLHTYRLGTKASSSFDWQQFILLESLSSIPYLTSCQMPYNHTSFFYNDNDWFLFASQCSCAIEPNELYRCYSGYICILLQATQRDFYADDQIAVQKSGVGLRAACFRCCISVGFGRDR